MTSLVALDVAAAGDLVFQFQINRPQESRAVLDPLAQGLAGEARPEPIEHRRLAIEGNRIGILREQDVGDQAGADLATGNHPRRQRGHLRRTDVPGACIHRTDNLAAKKFTGLIIDLVGDLLPDLDQGGAVGRELLRLRQIDDDRLQHRQVFQSLGPAHRGSPRLAFHRSRGRRSGQRLIGLDGGPRQGELVRIDFFRRAAKVALEQRLQLGLRRVAFQRRLLEQHLDRVALQSHGVPLLLGERMSRPFRHEQRLQLGGVGGQGGVNVSELWIL